MQVKVMFDTPHRETARLGDFVARRARFALRRLIGLNPRAHVKLADVAGPGGGIGTRCHVRLETDGGGTVAATAMAGDWRVAVEDALARAVRRLLRLWRRGSQNARVPSRLPHKQG